MRWWCSAQTVVWDWTWRPYIGVWILASVLIVWHTLLLRRVGSGHSGTARRDSARHRASFIAGVVCLWAALDWPLGPLGASYLASVHMIQFLIVGLIAPPLLLLGIPHQTYARLKSHGAVYRILQNLTHPLTAFFLFNIAMTLSHWPAIVDALMVSQLGSFVLDISWLVFGLVFWWPVVAPVPERGGFKLIHKVGYLALNAILIRPPFAILLFSPFPAYATYELAPPIPGTFALDDQQLAAIFMKAGSAWIMAGGIAVLIFQWHRKHVASGADTTRSSRSSAGTHGPAVTSVETDRGG